MSDENNKKVIYGIEIDSDGHHHALAYLERESEHEFHQLVREAQISNSKHGLFMVPRDGHVYHYALEKHHDGYKIIPKLHP